VPPPIPAPRLTANLDSSMKNDARVFLGALEQIAPAAAPHHEHLGRTPKRMEKAPAFAANRLGQRVLR